MTTMLLRPLTFALLLLLASGDGSKEGRRGNAHYEQGQYAEAAEAYQAGLAAREDEAPGLVRHALLNNLGAALFRSEQLDEAQAAFDQAMAAAPSEADFARAAYNAGNTAAAREELQAALDFYKKALLADPQHEDARFNYEFVKRQLEEQQQQQQQAGNQENDDARQQQQQQSGSGQDDQTADDFEDEGEQEQQQGPQQQGQEQAEQSEGEPQPEQQQQAETPDPNQLSRAQAERILQALEDEEEELLRQVQKLKTRPRRVEKDW